MKYAYKTLLFTYSFIFLICFVSAQTISLRNYNVEDGLPQSYGLAIEQDNNGNLWIATASGVSKFDGLIFENYTNDNGLAETFTMSLFKDKDGKIWMGHRKGNITIYDPETNAFTIPDYKGSIVQQSIIKIFIDSRDNIWLGTLGGGVYKIENDSLVQFNVKSGLLNNYVFDIYQKQDDIVWLATNNGINYYSYSSGKMNVLDLPLASKNIRTWFEASNGDLWLGTGNNGGVFILRGDIGGENMNNIQIFDLTTVLPKRTIRVIKEDGKGNMIVGTSGEGIVKTSLLDKNGQLKYMKTIDESNGLGKNNILSICLDYENNEWIGTLGGGITLYKGEMFETYTEKDGLADKEVFSIVKDSKGDYWFGSGSAGVSKFSYSEYNRTLNHEYNISSEDNDLSSNTIRSMIEDENKRIWIGTWGGGINILPLNAKKVSKVYKMEDGLPANHISAIHKNAKGDLYVGTISGVAKYDKRNDRFNSFLLEEGKTFSAYVYGLFEDSKGRLWIGTNGNGLYLYKDGEFTKYDDFNKDGRSDELIVYCIDEDALGNIWIGTEEQGIFKFNETDFEKFTTNEGLLSNTTYIILCNNDSTIWLGTPSGIDLYNSYSKQNSHYGKKDGFIGIETNLNAIFKENNGNIWFGTIGGATEYNPTFNKKNNIEPILSLNEIKIKGFGNLDLKSSEHIFPYTANEFYFDWIGISLTMSEKVRYQFKLDGYDDDWRDITQLNHVTYTNLDPGEYSFILKSANNDGLWNKEVLTFNFEIKPPWYLTIYAIVSYPILLLLIVYSFLKYRMKQVQKEKKILEDKVEERTVELVKEKERVEQANIMIEQKNKDITDSINYAKNIQEAILPIREKFQQTFPESFILFMPKDIVSGDFYWFVQQEDFILYAAADCTGHGVPGAFMSLMGNSILNQIVNTKHIYQPAEILNELHKEIRTALKQETEGAMAKDGMDISICKVNLKTNKLEFAGAFNSLILIRNKEITELKADRFCIGGVQTEDQRIFTNQELGLKKGDSVFILTDGYVDQFGGEMGKKLKSKNFKESLLKNIDLPMAQQHDIYKQNFIDWKGDLEQIDDVLLIGIRV